MSNDLPYYETMFGILVQDWEWSYSTHFICVKYMLTKDYLNFGCGTTDYTSLGAGTTTIEFLYPHWIKKQYYIEGVIEGQISLSCDGNNDFLISYTVRLMKVNASGVTSLIGSTGVITPTNTTFIWDALLNVGTEYVYPFYITVSPEVKVLDAERLYVEITIVANGNNLILYHSNDSTWEDLKISIPFRGL